jgi:hypothetical protein
MVNLKLSRRDQREDAMGHAAMASAARVWRKLGRNLTLGLALGLALVLTGCETMEGYRQRMDLNIGKTTDQLLIEWGSPVAKEPMSGGSEMWVFMRDSTSRTGGYWTTRSRTRVEVTKVDGKEIRRTVTYSEPYYEPEVITEYHCETRFVIGPDKRVQSVTFEGNGCVAEEIKQPTPQPASPPKG